MIYSIIITLHFIGDWVLQSRETAKSKKSNVRTLFGHIVADVYSYIGIICAAMLIMGNNATDTCVFLLINVISHGVIDWYLPSGETERAMINWTALDQILHLVILIESYNYYFT
jgi:hypothetical protein